MITGIRNTDGVAILWYYQWYRVILPGDSPAVA